MTGITSPWINPGETNTNKIVSVIRQLTERIPNAPTTVTASYTMQWADSSIICNGAGSITLTLLSAAAVPGRELYVKTIAAFTVVSASSNVVPIDSGTAGTAILPATAGSWAHLRSDGTNWTIIANGTVAAAGGNVNGPASSTVGDLALWNNTTGTLLKDVLTLPAANFPALTGDVTTSAGSLATTITAGVVTFAKIAAAAIATTAQYLSNTASLLLQTDQVWAAATLVTLTDGVTVTPDFSTGINFKWTIGGNRTLANPTNQKVGQVGFIKIVQDATGGRTISTWGTNYVSASGVKPSLSTAAGAVDILYYEVVDTSSVLVSIVSTVS